MTKTNGIILYRGPSMLDGSPIVVVATGLAKASQNGKTGGGLIQTWVMRADRSPIEAVNDGTDDAICGSCPHRGTVVNGKNVGRSCYVTIFQAPLNVYKAFVRGLYPEVSPAEACEMLMGRGVRLGAYGDPAAVPFEVWENALADADFWTGYTHQWAFFPEFAAFCMASCDTRADRVAAKFLGFRTFRVTGADSRTDSDKGEVVCPASAEAGNRTTCDACRACGGLWSKAKADIVITVHGATSKVREFQARIVA